MISRDLREKMFEERGQRCECGCGEIGSDLHHVFIGRRKRFPELDCEENLVIVNHMQHLARKFDNKQWREYFWQVQVDRFGYDHMMEWVSSLPAKIRPRMDFIERIT